MTCCCLALHKNLAVVHVVYVVDGDFLCFYFGGGTRVDTTQGELDDGWRYKNNMQHDMQNRIVSTGVNVCVCVPWDRII